MIAPVWGGAWGLDLLGWSASVYHGSLIGGYPTRAGATAASRGAHCLLYAMAIRRRDWVTCAACRRALVGLGPSEEKVC